MDVGHVIPEAIRELLEKRGTFQEWLSRLDELGSDYRPEVARKVRSDYSSRLGEVEAELEGHRAELEAALSDRTEAVEKVAAEHDARSAELEETQLRHVVGEFEDAEWERRRSEHQAQIDELEAELNSQRAAVESLQTVLGELTEAAALVDRPEEAVDAEPPIPDELLTADDEFPAPGLDEAGEKATPAEPAGAASAWMTQPLDQAAAADRAFVTEEPVDPGFVEREFADAELVEAADVDVDSTDDDEAEGVEMESVAEVEAAEEVTVVEPEPVLEETESGDFMDELEFLESLSLDDADNFDAVSAMLDEDDDSAAGGESKRETGDL